MAEKKKSSLGIDAEVYKNYKEYCERKGYIISKQVELFMAKEVEGKNEH